MAQDRPSESKPHVQGKKYPCLAILASVLAGLLLYSVLTRPSARANRFLARAGLGGLPDSAENIVIEKQRRLFGTDALFVGFNATEADIAELANGSAVAAAGEPSPLGSFHWGPKFSSWRRWDSTTQGCVYHFDRGSASMWLAIDEDSDAVYLYVFHHTGGWLRRVKSYLPFIR